MIDEARRAGVRIMTRTMAFGVYDDGLICACESPPGGGRLRDPTPRGGVLRARLWKIRARHIVAAAGAFERPMLFPDNDRPGVMLAGAADKYAQAYGVACGARAVIAANSDSAYRVAISLEAAGVQVVAIVDRRPPADAGAARERPRHPGPRVPRLGDRRSPRNHGGARLHGVLGSRGWA